MRGGSRDGAGGEQRRPGRRGRRSAHRPPTVARAGQHAAARRVALPVPTDVGKDVERVRPPGRDRARRARAPSGPYSHAVRIGRACCSAPARCRSTRRPASSSRATIGDQARQCLREPDAVVRAAGATLADAVRMAIYVTDMATFAQVNEAYARVLRRPIRPRARRSASRRCRGGAQVEIDADRRAAGLTPSRWPPRPPSPSAADVAARARGGRATSRATRRSCRRATLSERSGGDGRAQGREPAAHGLVQDPRRAEQARRARRRAARRGVVARQRGQPRPGAAR